MTDSLTSVLIVCVYTIEIQNVVISFYLVVGIDRKHGIGFYKPQTTTAKCFCIPNALSTSEIFS